MFNDASLWISANIARQFLRMMTIFTDTSFPELTYSLNAYQRSFVIHRFFQSLLLFMKTDEWTEISYVKILRVKIKFLKEFKLNSNNLQVTV